MPTSKNGREYFSKKQLQEARLYSALEYAKSAGYDLVQSGNMYYLREHDSMIFTRDGRWFWNSRGLKGGVLEFMQYYEGRSLPEAVNILTSGRLCPPQPRPANASTNLAERKPFELPERAPTFKRLFAYLCHTRKLDPEIVQLLIHQQRLYESIRYYPAPSTGELREAHNAVFVALDEMGLPRGAFQRGTNTFGTAYKREVTGSDKKYAFCCPGREGVTKLSVFEAAIDAISHATLAKLAGEDWTDRDRIALGGVWEGPLLYFLKRYPQHKDIELCLDQDATGASATVRLLQRLRESGYKEANGYTVYATDWSLTAGKDWNEELMAFCGRLNKQNARR